MSWTLGRAAAAVVSGFVLACALTRPAAAHPHVWVVFESTVLFEKGAMSGIRHKWTFDDMYSTMAIEGLDANKDGVYDREELAELAKVNMDGLKEFDYFTFVTLDKQPLKLKPPVDYFLEHKDGALTLQFTVPFEQPVLTDANGFAFAVYDPGFFIAFDMAKESPLKLGEGAPKGCKPMMVASEKDSADVQKLAESLTAQLGAGSSSPPSITVQCGQ